MFTSTIAGILLLATSILAQSCTDVRDPAHPTGKNNSICGTQGRVTQTTPIRAFISPDRTEAGRGDLCLDDPDFISFGCESATNICNFYDDNVRAMGFPRDRNSGIFLYHKLCYLKRGDCRLINGDFEAGYTSSDAPPLVTNGQPVGYDPWEFSSTAPGNAQAQLRRYDEDNDAPVSQGDYFLEMSTPGQFAASLTQQFILASDARYQLEVSYSTRSRGDSQSYDIIVSYAGEEISRETLVQPGDFDTFVTFLQSAVVPGVTKTDGTQPLTISVARHPTEIMEPGKRIPIMDSSITMGLDTIEFILEVPT